MRALAAANLALKFVLELCAFAAFAVWGAGVSAVVAVVAPAVAIVLWSLFAAPKSGRRLPDRVRIPFELAVFALAAVALIAAGHPVWGAVFGAVAAVNAVLLTLLGDWAQ